MMSKFKREATDARPIQDPVIPTPVLVERPGRGVARIVLNRPDRKNALNWALWVALSDAIREVAASPDDRVVVLTGSGPSFCSGGDLSDPAVFSEDVAEALQLASGVALALHELPKPTLAQVRGDAVGGGLSLALACDIVIASDNARLWPSFTRRGMTLDCGSSWLLPRMMGMQRAKELAFLADAISATMAEEIGLVAHVVPDTDLERYVLELALRIAELPRSGVAFTKQLLNDSTARTMREALAAEIQAQADALKSPEFRASVDAFLNRTR